MDDQQVNRLWVIFAVVMFGCAITEVLAVLVMLIFKGWF